MSIDDEIAPKKDDEVQPKKNWFSSSSIQSFLASPVASATAILIITDEYQIPENTAN